MTDNNALPTVTTSKKFTWNLADLGKGLIVATLSPVVPIVQSAIASGAFPSWKVIGIAALGGFVAYMAKNFFTPSQTIITPPPSNLTVSK